MKALAARAETLVASLALGGIMVLPLAEIAARRFFQSSVPGSAAFASNLTLWLGLLGGAIAAREGKLLTLATGEFLPKGRAGEILHTFSGVVGAAITTLLAIGGWRYMVGDHEAGGLIADLVPVWIADLALPVGFALIAVRLVWRASPHWIGRAIALLGIVAAFAVNQERTLLEAHALWPWLVLVLAAGLLGAPIFALLGGIALFSTLHQGQPPALLSINIYDELTNSPSIAAIPLFTLAGFLLAEGKASERLLRLLRAWFGWAPGGTAVAAATLCAFFTLFTGGSGVTILVLGGLLLPTLVGDRYRERFSIGLLTASGSLGLLFPLSLPLMLFSIMTGGAAAMEDLFIGGLLPGLMMLGLISVMGVREAMRSGAERTPFTMREALASLWNAKFEIFLPIFVIGTFLTGTATLVESAPMAALYTLVVQRFIHRDLPSWKDVLRVMNDCVALVGSVLLILGVAKCLTDYFVYVQIPDQLMAWTQAHIHSPLAFLLTLNVFLLLVGTVMDIFSAIVVVVPLLLPLAQQFGIDPVHLGIIFVANLELGFLHPPLGLNLLLASVRFKKPVLEVTWATLPMLGILAIGVLLITYWNGLTLGLVHWLKP